MCAPDRVRSRRVSAVFVNGREKDQIGSRVTLCWCRKWAESRNWTVPYGSGRIAACRCDMFAHDFSDCRNVRSEVNCVLLEFFRREKSLSPIYPGILTLRSGIPIRYDFATLVGQDRYILSSLFRHSCRICVFGADPPRIRILCVDVFLRDIYMTTSGRVWPSCRASGVRERLRCSCPGELVDFAGADSGAW